MKVNSRGVISLFSLVFMCAMKELADNVVRCSKMKTKSSQSGPTDIVSSCFMYSVSHSFHQNRESSNLKRTLPSSQTRYLIFCVPARLGFFHCGKSGVDRKRAGGWRELGEATDGRRNTLCREERHSGGEKEWLGTEAGSHRSTVQHFTWGFFANLARKVRPLVRAEAGNEAPTEPQLQDADPSAGEAVWHYVPGFLMIIDYW